MGEASVFMAAMEELIEKMNYSPLYTPLWFGPKPILIVVLVFSFVLANRTLDATCTVNWSVRVLS